MALVIAYTDGSADNTTGYGGYGVVLSTNHKGKKVIKNYVSNKYCNTTNNRMELKAVIRVLQLCSFGHKIDIHSDSKYCVNSINLRLDGWIERDQLHKKKNPEIWAFAYKKIREHRVNGSNIKFIWIRGHAGNSMNEIADKLANKARLQVKEGVSCKPNN